MSSRARPTPSSSSSGLPSTWSTMVRSPYFMPFFLFTALIIGSVSFDMTHNTKNNNNNNNNFNSNDNNDNNNNNNDENNNNNGNSNLFRPEPKTTKQYTYRIVRSLPHDPDAFTQGLCFDETGQLYEGTGLNYKSTLRLVELETGKVLKSKSLESKYFGEGIVTFGNKIYQITWREHKGFVYNKEDWSLIKTWEYNYEGWGLTHNDQHIIMSDGSDIIRFLDPETLSEVRRISVKDGTRSVNNLNELEFIDGEIYANIWITDKIAIIDPNSGRVRAWIDLQNIMSSADMNGRRVDVLNGIAFDKLNRRLYITGKLWPKMYQIELVPAQGGKRRT